MYFALVYYIANYKQHGYHIHLLLLDISPCSSQLTACGNRLVMVIFPSTWPPLDISYCCYTYEQMYYWLILLCLAAPLFTAPSCFCLPYHTFWQDNNMLLNHHYLYIVIMHDPSLCWTELTNSTYNRLAILLKWIIMKSPYSGTIYYKLTT